MTGVQGEYLRWIAWCERIDVGNHLRLGSWTDRLILCTLNKRAGNASPFLRSEFH